MNERDMAVKNLIFKIKSGSSMYGTTTPESDEDYVGVFIPDPEYVVGLHRCEQVVLNTKVSTTKCNTKDDVDCTLYSLPKFIQLAIGNNPNILEMFFAPKESVVFDTPWGIHLRQAYPFFVAQTSYERFKGYAIAQQHRMMDKPKKPTITWSFLRKYIPGLREADLSKEITTAHKMAGERRRKYVEKYGYDIKNASHLIRLLLEAEELQKTGKLSFPLDKKTADMLVAIKLGGVELDDVVKVAGKLSIRAEQAHKETKLQKVPNLSAINDLQMHLLREFWDAST